MQTEPTDSPAPAITGVPVMGALGGTDRAVADRILERVLPGKNRKSVMVAAFNASL